MMELTDARGFCRWNPQGLVAHGSGVGNAGREWCGAESDAAPRASVRVGGTGEGERPLNKAAARAGKHRGFSPVALGVCVSKGRQTAVRCSGRGGGDYPWAQRAQRGPEEPRKSVPGRLPPLPVLLSLDSRLLRAYTDVSAYNITYRGSFFRMLRGD